MRFRGSDEQLDREIAALETIARLRLRRVTQDLSDLERDLRELRRERFRRRTTASPTVPGAADPAAVTS